MPVPQPIPLPMQAMSLLAGVMPAPGPKLRQPAPQMVAMQIPPCDPAAVKTALLDKYGIEIPVFEWQDHFIVRLSCQGYNTRAQMDVLIGALTAVLQLRAAANEAIRAPLDTANVA